MANRSLPSTLPRSTMRSQVIRPEHSSSVSTDRGSAVSSPMNGRNVPEGKSAGWEAASLRFSIDLGVNTIRGRCCRPSECRRSRWKYDAGVDGCATTNASSAAIASPRSIRAGGGPDAGLLLPLRGTGGDELVDHRLGAVDEVAELRLPHHQRLGPSDRVTV